LKLRLDAGYRHIGHFGGLHQAAFWQPEAFLR
jgi:hypothetical protein